MWSVFCVVPKVKIGPEFVSSLMRRRVFSLRLHEANFFRLTKLLQLPRAREKVHQFC